MMATFLISGESALPAPIIFINPALHLGYQALVGLIPRLEVTQVAENEPLPEVIFGRPELNRCGMIGVTSIFHSQYSAFRQLVLSLLIEPVTGFELRQCRR
jgi:hypothetical protein